MGTRNEEYDDSEEIDRKCCDDPECGKGMNEGFAFESDATNYCSVKCLLTTITWEEYIELHDDGNGDAYWTDWYDEYNEDGYPIRERYRLEEVTRSDNNQQKGKQNFDLNDKRISKSDLLIIKLVIWKVIP